MESKKDILLQVAAGNETSFRQLIAFYAPQLLNFIRGLCKSRERAEEGSARDIYLRYGQLWDSLPEIRNFRNFYW